MSLRTTNFSAPGGLDVFSEDFQTVWIPDVAACVDYGATLAWPSLAGGSFSKLVVPRPNRKPMEVFMLPFKDQVHLHSAVEPFRQGIDRLLRPTVCAYRRGAEKGYDYRNEYTRFRDIVQAGISDSQYVVKADVRDFFATSSFGLAVETLERLTNQRAMGLRRMWGRLHSVGIETLPAGYADARLLANVILHSVDATISWSFTRWVDDYRIFAGSLRESEQVLETLSAGLDRLGLSLNREKSAVIPRAKAVGELLGRSLESVYHPDAESPAQTSAALSTLFVDAASDPVRRRRELRFSLRRLQKSKDPLAVDFALSSLISLPWEAPRLVSYLTQFRSDTRVQCEVHAAFVKACELGDDWLVGRLSPLIMKLPKEHESLEAARSYASASTCAASWGLALRVMAQAKDRAGVLKETAEHCLDPRGALVALRDVDIPALKSLRVQAPLTASSLEASPAPLPFTDSIL